MQALRDIFNVWPNHQEMAQEIGELPDTVYRWKRRKRIPENAWAAIIAGAGRRAATITADDLMRLNRKPKPRGGGSRKHPNNPKYKAANGAAHSA